jgi:serine/threonine protein kinase
MGRAKISIKSTENYRGRKERNNRNERKTKSETINEDFFKLIDIENIIKIYNEKGDLYFKDCIGSGSESYVFKTLLNKDKKIIAAKIIINQEENTRKFNEIIISKKVKHKNVVNYYGCFKIKEDGLDCLLMDLAKYGNIKDFQCKTLKRNTLSETFLCFITFQILEGLKYLESCKIAHLDLKPQNITIDEYLNVKLIDFSISIDYSKISSKKIELPFNGTNFYMAPEVLSSKMIETKDLGKVDLYSLGVMLYNLAFSSYPFGLNHEDSNDYKGIFNKIMNNEIEIEDNTFSPQFMDFLKKLLEKDINQRININQALNHSWVKGAKILYEEKEKLYNAGSFLSLLITDQIKEFNDYIFRLN